MTIWILKVSRDGGKTWEIESGNNSFYRSAASAKRRADEQTRWHRENLTPAAHAYGWIYKAVEYGPTGDE